MVDNACSVTKIRKNNRKVQVNVMEEVGPTLILGQIYAVLAPKTTRPRPKVATFPKIDD